MNNLPEQYGILMGCPFNSSGVGDCTFKQQHLISTVRGERQRLLRLTTLPHNPSTGQFDFVNGKRSQQLPYPAHQRFDRERIG